MLYVTYSPHRQEHLPIAFPEYHFFLTDEEVALTHFRHFVENVSLQQDFILALRAVDKARASFVEETLFDPLYLYLRQRFFDEKLGDTLHEMAKDMPPRVLGRLWQRLVWGFPHPVWMRAFFFLSSRLTSPQSIIELSQSLLTLHDLPALVAAVNAAEEVSPSQHLAWVIAFSYIVSNRAHRAALAPFARFLPNLLSEAINLAIKDMPLHPRARKALLKHSEALFGKSTSTPVQLLAVAELSQPSSSSLSSQKPRRLNKAQKMLELAYRSEKYSYTERKWIVGHLTPGILAAMIMRNGLPSPDFLRLAEQTFKRRKSPPSALFLDLAQAFATYGLPLTDYTQMIGLLREHDAPFLAELLSSVSSSEQNGHAFSSSIKSTPFLKP